MLHISRYKQAVFLVDIEKTMYSFINKIITCKILPKILCSFYKEQIIKFLNKMNIDINLASTSARTAVTQKAGLSTSVAFSHTQMKPL